MTNGTDGSAAQRATRDRVVIHATCSVHGGVRNFTNLVVSKRDGNIVLDPHATGACVIILGEAAANQLFDLLRAWLR
ncbi:MAG: hypothetical protein M3460_03235 [Actinomycetota bacterium]|nr:hypothetical protein [Actinomycetota bacterium]